MRTPTEPTLIPTQRPVLAGIDGSDESLSAAAVAAVEAQLRGLPLRLLRYPARETRPARPPRRHPLLLDPVTIRDVAGRLPDRYPGTEVITCDPGDRAGRLIEQSGEASLLVVAATQTGGYDGLFERWLHDRVVTHARCPVLVVRPDTDPAAIGRPVILGVDGSEHCAAAVPLAFEAAAVRNVPLHAVAVHHRSPGATYRPADADDHRLKPATGGPGDLLDQTLDRWRDKYPNVPVVAEPMYAADVAATLVEASANAGLVVVGSRGRSAITSPMLGSVSRALVRHAHCPVMVTHAWC